MNNRNRCASAIALDFCGGQGGAEVLTNPLARNNRPGLPALSYRIGTHASFLETMKARLSVADTSGAMTEEAQTQAKKLAEKLSGLTARDSSDPSIALLDAWAIVADVLTFYQERIANEGYLRTATEERSIQELARLVGTGQRSGVAATVPLAYTIDPNTKDEVVIPAGSRVQSVPGQNEKPQTFETSEDLKAYAELNLLQPRMSRAQRTILKEEGQEGSDGKKQKIPVIYLKGAHTNLKIDDRMLIVHENSEEKIRKECLYRVATVEPNAKADRTRVVLKIEQGMGDRAPNPNSEIQKVCVFRTKTAPFGHNAPLKPTIVDENSITRYTEWRIDNPTLAPDIPEIDFTYKIEKQDLEGKEKVKLTLINISTNREFIKSIKWTWMEKGQDEKTSEELKSGTREFNSYSIEGLSYESKVIVKLTANLISSFILKDGGSASAIELTPKEIILYEMKDAPVININIPDPPLKKEGDNFIIQLKPEHSIDNFNNIKWSWSIDNTPHDTSDKEDFIVSVGSGDYNVTLLASNNYENWNSICRKTIRVYDKPQPNFIYSLIEDGEDNFIVKMTDISTGKIDKITWSSKNGKIKKGKPHDRSVEIAFSYQENKPYNYDVSLSADGPGSITPIVSEKNKIENLFFFSEEDQSVVSEEIKRRIKLINRSIGNYTHISFTCIPVGGEAGDVRKDDEDIFSFIKAGDYMISMTGTEGEDVKKQVYSKIIIIS